MPMPSRFEQSLHRVYSRRGVIEKTAEITTAGGLALHAINTRKRTPEAKSPESFDTLPMAESIRYITQEIDQNRELNTLRDYDPKKLKTFAGHAYNIFSKATESKLKPNEILARTEFDGNKSIAQSHIDEAKSFGQPYIEKEERLEEIGGNTFPKDGDHKKMSILINYDFILFKKSLLRQPRIRALFPNKQHTVLGTLLFALTHEAFHLETPAKKLPVPLILPDADGEATIVSTSGFTINGYHKNKGESGSWFSQIDETSVYLLQDSYIKSALGDLYEQYPQVPKPVQQPASDLFKILGLNSAKEILAFRRGETSVLDLAQNLVPLLPDPSLKYSKQITPLLGAILFLMDFNRALNSETIFSANKMVSDLQVAKKLNQPHK